MCDTIEQVTPEDADRDTASPDASALEGDDPLGIRNEDKDWIRAEIATAVAGLTDRIEPHGWRRFLRTCREHGSVAAYISIVIALFGMLLTAVYAVTARATKDAIFETKTDTRLDSIDDHLKKIDVTLTTLQLQAFASGPVTPHSAAAVGKLATENRSAAIHISPEIVQDAGTKLVRASATLPEAWHAALSLAGYRSFLNTALIKVPPSPGPPATGFTRYATKPSPGRPIEEGSVETIAPTFLKDNQARLNPIGSDLNTNTPLQPSILVIRGGSIDLDGMDVKNVILVGVEVYYSGERVVLKNVQFVNCTFEMPLNPKSQRFALAELQTSPSISFASSAD